jgi:hypothetical protein
MKRQSLLANGIALTLGILLLIATAAISALGQAGTSTIRGTVTDPQGNVVAGAAVTLTNVGTASARTTTTSDLGVYSFEFVPVADYKIEIEAKGFKKAVVNDVHALVSKPSSVDVKLEIGNVSETVTVNAGSAELLVNREDATTGNTFVAKQITELPGSGRNIMPFLTLQPAVTRDGQVSGARNDQNNFTLDGVDANESERNTVGLSGDDPTTSQLPTNNTALRLNAEAIQEFRVTTSNPNSSQGRSSGGQITLVTKGGSNEWHGSAFEFYRSKGLTANDFFNNRLGRFTATDADVIAGKAKAGDPKAPRPQLVRHTFGGTASGPIIKDRAFFFYSFERQTRVTQTTVLRTVPLASLGRGELRFVGCPPGTPSSQCGSTVTPSIQTITTAQLNTIFPNIPGGMNPLAAAALAQAAAKYPANDFGLTGDSTSTNKLNTAGFRFNAPTPVTLNSHVGKFDFNLTSKQQLFVRTTIIYDLTSLAPAFPDTPAPKIWSHPWGTAIGHTWTISNTLVNNFHYGLTREAFTQQGDSAANAISFRFIFSPLLFTRTLARKTPVQNFVDDVSWVRGNHTWQFGTNIRIIRNQRTSFASAFDSATTNPSGYSGGAGASTSTPVNTFAPITSPRSIVQNAVTALIGRFSGYAANFTFNNDGSILNSGLPTQRNFATEEYEWYGQDVWKFRSNLTLTGGLRYSLSRPIYETKGFEMKSNIPLSDVFAQRLAGAKAGNPVNTLITFDKSGRANNRPSMYNWDKNNFQPRVAVAWSPAFKHGLLSRFFGKESQSVLRGGFAITNDQYGEQLAVSFDLNNVVGFVSSQSIPVNTFCTNNASCVAPLFTGFGQAVRPLPKIVVPAKLNFPNLQPADNSRRIEASLDSNLVAPINYSWNVTFERQLPKGILVQASYLGRYAKHLIAARDVMALNNLIDPKSGMDWYTAATQLEILRTQGVPASAVQQIPYFANLFPSNLAALINANSNFCCVPTTVGGQPTTQTQAVYFMAAANFFGNDWTDTQDGLDQVTGRNLFFHPQYGALSTYSSIGHSWYDAGTLSIRERLGRSLTMDFNYTLSHSLDDASGAQTSGAYNYALFIENPIRQHDWYANSDFDIRHIINANAIWELPFGRGRMFFGGAGKAADAIVGGWQLSSIFRWNSGLPASAPIDDARWATNWNAQSYTVRAQPFGACPEKGGVINGTVIGPKLFGCDPTGNYRKFRNARPGESGDRNVFRLPGYFGIDMGLAKEFRMPWSETQRLQIRVEAINVTNTQRMGTLLGGRAGYGIALDPAGAPFGCTPGTGGNCVENPANPDPTFSNFSAIQGTPRQIQFGATFRF